MKGLRLFSFWERFVGSVVRSGGNGRWPPSRRPAGMKRSQLHEVSAKKKTSINNINNTSTFSPTKSNNWKVNHCRHSTYISNAYFFFKKKKKKTFIYLTVGKFANFTSNSKAGRPDGTFPKSGEFIAQVHLLMH